MTGSSIARPIVIAVIVVFAVIGAAAPAWADGVHTAVPHPDSPLHAIGVPAQASSATSSPWPGFGWALLFAGITAAALVRARPRRTLVVALVVLIAVFAFEAALHSVHHGLGPDPESCRLAAAAAHVTAVAIDEPPVVAVDRPARAGVRAVPYEPRPTRPLAPDQGRAPPFAA